MRSTANPYYLAGTFGAASAVLATAAARTIGRPVRPDARASVIANLMSAGLSAASAFKVYEIGDELTAFPWTERAGATVFSVLESVFERSEALLGGELQSDQVQAYRLGAGLCLAYASSVVRWDTPEDGRARLTGDLARANMTAQALGVGEAGVGKLLEVARTHQLSLVFLAKDILAAAESIMNTMLRR